MHSSSETLGVVRNAATPRELHFPHGVNNFLTTVRHGPVGARAFVETLGQILFETGGNTVRLIGPVFSDISSTMSELHLVATLTEVWVRSGLASKVAGAARVNPSAS